MRAFTRSAGNSRRQACAVASVTAAAALVALLAACAASPGPAPAPEPHPAPTSYAQCNDLTPGRADGFVAALGSDWSGEAHRYGDTVTVYACADPHVDGVVRVVPSGDGIRVQPAQQKVQDFPSGVVPFQVVVERGRGPASISVRRESVGSASGGRGPAVQRATDNWSFTWDDHDVHRTSP